MTMNYRTNHLDQHVSCTDPLSIDNFLTTRKSCFTKTLTLETGVSHHRKLIGTMLRSAFVQGKPKTIFYNCSNNFINLTILKNTKTRIAIYDKF